jgi:hypothetical protein
MYFPSRRTHPHIRYPASQEEAIAVEEEEEEEEEVVAVLEARPDAAQWEAKLARLNAEANIVAEDMRYSLCFLWLDKNIAVAVDQVFSKGQRSPITEYFIWPRRDAWEELKVALEAKSWIAEK